MASSTPYAPLTVRQVLDSPIFAPTCEHHHDTFPVGTGHLGDIAVDELMVLIHHKVFEVSWCQDSPFTARCAVDSTGIHYLIPPGLVEDGSSGQLRLVRKKQRRREGERERVIAMNLSKKL